MEEQRISDLIRQFVASNGKDDLFWERKVLSIWPSVMGDYIANNTSSVSIKQGVLYVKVLNASLRFELNTSRSLIIKKLNDAVGGEVVKSIVFN
jgi:hypothetical protein